MTQTPQWIELLPDRVRVVVSQVVTWLVAASSALTLFRWQVASVFPDQAEPVAAIVTPILGVIAIAVLIMRGRTPVPAAVHGLLPIHRGVRRRTRLRWPTPSNRRSLPPDRR